MKNKKEFVYFFLCTIMYVVLNFALTKIFNISFNVHSNGNITLGTYHILRLVEIVLISVFCFFKKFKFLVYFDICLIISWITDFFINFYFFDKSVSIAFLLLSVIVMFGYMLNCVSDKAPLLQKPLSLTALGFPFGSPFLLLYTKVMGKTRYTHYIRCKK